MSPAIKYSNFPERPDFYTIFPILLVISKLNKNVINIFLIQNGYSLSIVVDRCFLFLTSNLRFFSFLSSVVSRARISLDCK